MKKDFEVLVGFFSLTFTAVIACCADETVFVSENINEHFVPESLGAKAEVHRTGMGFVKANVHDPCGKEGQPSDGDHHLDLVLCQLMGKAVDINQPHLRGHTLQGCYCQPAS